MGLTAAQLLAISAILEVRLGRNHPLLASVDKARKEQSVIESDTQMKSGPGGAGNTELRGLTTNKEWL